MCARHLRHSTYVLRTLSLPGADEGHGTVQYWRMDPKEWADDSKLGRLKWGISLQRKVRKEFRQGQWD
jgi:hypothetical protein